MTTVKLLLFYLLFEIIRAEVKKKTLPLTFFKIDVFKVMEEPEEYIVEEKLHFISKRVGAEPTEGTLTLK